MSSTDHSKRAEELFRQGYNCAQSVFASFCDVTNMDFETALRLSSSFGGGMGRLREVCGAVSGMFMVLGAKYGYTDAKDHETKTEHYKRVQSLAEQFKGEYGSIICRELLGLSGTDNSYVPEKRTDSYYKKRPCAEYVAYSARLIEEFINNCELEVNLMKIAVACEGLMVTEHFGHCQNFNIYETKNGKIENCLSIPNPGHKPGFLPNFLGDMGVKVIISGGMGGGAVEIFNERNIEVVTGARGEAAEAVENYLAGTLKTTGSVCHEHQHHDECGQ